MVGLRQGRQEERQGSWQLGRDGGALTREDKRRDGRRWAGRARVLVPETEPGSVSCLDFYVLCRPTFFFSLHSGRRCLRPPFFPLFGRGQTCGVCAWGARSPCFHPIRSPWTCSRPSNVRRVYLCTYYPSPAGGIGAASAGMGRPASHNGQPGRTGKRAHSKIQAARGIQANGWEWGRFPVRFDWRRRTGKVAASRGSHPGGGVEKRSTRGRRSPAEMGWDVWMDGRMCAR